MSRAVDNHTVAHLWANREADRARTPSGTLFFEGDSIYSYGHHFTIAKHVYNEAGEHAVLFTERSYSKTTAEQINLVRQASSHIERIEVPDPNDDRITLFDAWSVQIKNLGHHLLKARKPEIYILQIHGVVNAAKRYADFFGYELPGNLVQAGQIENYEQYAEAVKQETALQEARIEKMHRDAIVRQKRELKEWRAGKRDYIRSADGFDYLRMSENARVETSQRVEIPPVVAKEFYHLILATLAKGGCKNCDMKLMDR